MSATRVSDNAGDDSTVLRDYPRPVRFERAREIILLTEAFA